LDDRVFLWLRENPFTTSTLNIKAEDSYWSYFGPFTWGDNGMKELLVL